MSSLWRSEEARRLFDRHCRPIRSWTVRDQYSRDALLAMRVDPGRVAIGASWGWLYESPSDRSEWAAAIWRELKIDPARPLLAVNISLAAGFDLSASTAALDTLYRDDGLQIAFVCLDFRHPGFHRDFAEIAQSAMTAPSVIVTIPQAN